MLSKFKLVVTSLINGKMKQIAGDNSHQIQAQTVNIGMSYTEVKNLCQDLIQSELDTYKQDAFVEAEKRFNKISDRLLERLSQLEDSTRQRFQEPSIQFAVNETMKEYIRSGKEELGDDLIDLMIERLKVEEHTTKQSLIDEARQILPKLSNSAVAVLAMLTFVKLIFHRERTEFVRILEKLTSLAGELGTPQSLDIAYLEQARCGQSLSFVTSNKNFVEEMKNTYDVLFSHPVSLEEFNQFMREYGINQEEKTPILLAILIFFDTKAQGMIYKYSTFPESRIKDEIKKYMNLLKDRLSLYSEEEVRAYFLGISPMWQNVINLFERKDIKSFMLSPVGMYIGTRKLSRVLGEEVSIDIFYKNN